MRTTLAVFAAITTLSSVAAAAEVRNPFLEQPGPKVLLQSADVQQTLELSQQQRAQLAERQSVDEMLEVLSPSQRRQLQVLDAQREGGYALTHELIVNYLKLSDRQQKQVAEAVEANAAEHAKMRDFMSRARFRSKEAMDQYVAGFRDKADQRLTDVLTAEQKKNLQQVFAGEVAFAVKAGD